VKPAFALGRDSWRRRINPSWPMTTRTIPPLMRTIGQSTDTVIFTSAR